MQANFKLMTRALAFVGGLQMPFTESQTSEYIVMKYLPVPVVHTWAYQYYMFVSNSIT